MICIRSFLQEIRFLSLSYWWWCLFMFPLESPFPFFILSCASMLWIEWISDFLISLFCFFSCSFWWSYNNTVVLFCQYIFVFLWQYFHLLFVLYIVILLFVCIFYYFLLILSVPMISFLPCVLANATIIFLYACATAAFNLFF